MVFCTPLAWWVDQPTIAADILCEAGMSDYDCSELDEYEKENLRAITDNRVKLKGL